MEETIQAVEGNDSGDGVRTGEVQQEALGQPDAVPETDLGGKRPEELQPGDEIRVKVNGEWKTGKVLTAEQGPQKIVGTPEDWTTPEPSVQQSQSVPEGVPSEPQGPLTTKQLKELRAKFFTVRHVLLKDCDHRLDMINEPRHKHCENCWFQWFNTHGKLIESVDAAYKEHGKDFIIKLRGVTFFKMFLRFMATVAHWQHQAQMEALQKAQVQNGQVDAGIGVGVQQADAGDAGSPVSENTTVSIGKNEGSGSGGEGTQQGS